MVMMVSPRHRAIRGVAVGVLGVGLLIGIGVFLASRSVTVTVRNDTGRAATIADCVDDGQQVAPGDEFRAEGHPKHGALACLVTSGAGPSRCFVIPQVKSVKGTVALTRLMRVRDSECR
jgi:hypothetical protein